MRLPKTLKGKVDQACQWAKSRWELVQAWVKRNPKRASVMGALTLLALAAFCIALILGVACEDVLLNLSMEIGGALLIYLLLERWLDKEEKEEEEFRSLVLMMGSPVRDEAVAAAHKLRHTDAWTNGSLHEADLAGARLSRAYLGEVVLIRANLALATLQGSTLGQANLAGSDINRADLRHTYLVNANMCGSNLAGAHLDEAQLRHSDLQGAILVGASLRKANLESAKLGRALIIETGENRTILDSDTVLPDGTRWSERRSLKEFGAMIDTNEDWLLWDLLRGRDSPDDSVLGKQ
jgi:uncharacterized protein YjbI with pentapeptide repeats